MNFVAPESLAQAYAALAAPGSACLAGGQSLVAAMNLGVTHPEQIVSLRLLEALRGIEVKADGGVRLGAMTTHAEIASLDVASAPSALLSRTARQVAYPAVRTRGTIGGSVALADPAADYPVALVAMDATFEVGGTRGTRMVRAREFFRALFETALEPQEILIAVHLPPGPSGAGAAYEKLSIVAGDFAIVSVAAIGGAELDLAVGGCAPTPLLLKGVRSSDEALLEAGRTLASNCDPPSDHRASADYRRRVLPEIIRRAGRAAASLAR